jgi:hypothetical protein
MMLLACGAVIEVMRMRGMFAIEKRLR